MSLHSTSPREQGETLWSNLLGAHVSQSTSKSDIVARSLLLAVRPELLRRLKPLFEPFWELSLAIGLGAVFLDKSCLRLRPHCDPNNRGEAHFPDVFRLEGLWRAARLLGETS